MKLTNCIIAAAIGSLGTIYCAKAQDTTTTTSTTTTTTSPSTSMMDRDTDHDDGPGPFPYYRKQELDVDLFASGALGESTLEHLSGSNFRHHSLWGGGAGITGFFCKYVGVGGEFDADARTHRFVDDAAGNVYLRVPICATGLAPYVFGGGGYQFEEIRQSFGQAGAGLEFRFCKNLGIFVDGRWVFTAHTDDYALARAGFRMSF